MFGRSRLLALLYPLFVAALYSVTGPDHRVVALPAMPCPGHRLGGAQAGASLHET